MKRRTKILLIIIGILIIGIASLVVWQRNNISALFATITKTEGQIATELDSSKKQLESHIKEKYNTDLVSDFTAEEERKIISGEISAEDAVKILEEKYQDSKKEQPAQKVENDNKNESAVDDLIGEKVIQLYSLKAFYLGKLGQMEANVKKDYYALPKAEKNLIGKQALVTKYLGVASSLLSQCDAEVNKTIKELEAGLKALNEDTSIIKKIKEAYENEKALKKAYYLKLLGE